MNYPLVGTILLKDERGAIVPNIVGASFGNPLLINMEILRQWVMSAHKEDCTWRVLVDTLKNNGCVYLATEIKEALDTVQHVME